ncbi:MAG TPA: acylphosphatase [Vicinamibacterales bacterium]|jgi:acylphosphatase
MIIARRLTVFGRVQGVGFRWFVIERATAEGVTGWVRNLPDGRVEIVAEGEAEAFERFERAVRNGPPRSRVDDVTTDILAPTGRFPTFSARH